MILADVRSESAFGFMVVALIVVFGPSLAQRRCPCDLIGLLIGEVLIETERTERTRELGCGTRSQQQP